MTSSGAAAHLSADPALAAVIVRVGACRLKVIPREPYEALVRAVASQQLHARAAEAILGRFVALFPGTAFPTARAVLAVDEAVLRGCGLSANKAASVRDIAARTMDGTVPGAAEAAGLDDAALIERLATIRGVGRWTVEMMLMLSLGRPDVLPVDDFGVRDGWRVIQRLPALPRPRDLATIGQAWSPFRSAAAWYLWRASEAGKTAGRRITLPGAAR